LSLAPASACNLSKRIAVLLSGAGSNLAALIRAMQTGEIAAEWAGVFSDQAAATGLTIAEQAGVPAQSFARDQFASRKAQEHALFDAVIASAPELIVLAGFMRIISAETIARLPIPMLNLHPSLLPKYPGLDTHARALAAKDREHGASVHFVNAQLDGGPVLAQSRIAIVPGETSAALAARLKPVEHKLLVACVRLCTQKCVSVQHGRISIDGVTLLRPLERSDASELELC
jgi:phosphoribosylglycinamide formyltransferase 1